MEQEAHGEGSWVLESLQAPTFPDIILHDEPICLGRHYQPYADTISRKSVTLTLQKNPFSPAASMILATVEGKNPVVVKRASDGAEVKLQHGSPFRIDLEDLIRLQGYEICYEYIFKWKQLSYTELQLRENALLLQLQQTRLLLSKSEASSPRKRKRGKEMEEQLAPLSSPRKRKVPASPRKGKRHYTAIVTRYMPTSSTLQETRSAKNFKIDPLFNGNTQLWTVQSPKPEVEYSEAKFWIMSTKHSVDVITVAERVHFQFCDFEGNQLSSSPVITDDVFLAFFHWVLSSSIDSYLSMQVLSSITTHFVSPCNTKFMKEQVLFIINKLFALCIITDTEFRYRYNKLPLVVHFVLSIKVEFPETSVLISPENELFFAMLLNHLEQSNNVQDLEQLKSWISLPQAK